MYTIVIIKKEEEDVHRSSQNIFGSCYVIIPKPQYKQKQKPAILFRREPEAFVLS